MTASTAPRSRRWPLVVAGLGLLIAVPLGLILYVRWAGDRELRRAVDETTADDPGWRLPDLLAAREAGMPPPDQNSAVLLAGVQDQLPRTGWHPELDDAAWLRTDASPNRLPTDADSKNLQAAVADLAGPLAVVRRTADLAGGRQPIPVPDLATFTVGTLSHPEWARSAAYVAVLDAAAAAARNDPTAALLGVRAGCGVARALDEEPVSIGQLVRIACTAVAAKSCERVLAWTDPSDDLAGVQEAFRREAAAPVARWGLRGERANFDVLMTNLSAGQLGGVQAEFGAHVGGQLGAFVIRPRWTADHAAGLRAFNRLLAELDQPPHARPARQGLKQPGDGRTPTMTTLLLPAVDKVLTACQRHEATMRCAEVAVACERHRRQTGKFPGSLAEVPANLLAAVPADPFDGRPLRLKRTPDGLAVYSVGQDLKDDDGRPGHPDGDVVFRLYDVAARRQPAADPKK